MGGRPIPEQILTFDEALAEVLIHAANVEQPTSETVPLLESAGRILAQPILADRDQPPFNRSTRDGYALTAASLRSPIKIIGSLRAGEHWPHPPLKPHEAVEIMTGAPLPEGSDAVLMVEHANITGDSLEAAAGRNLQPGTNVVPRGTEAAANQTVLPAGRMVRAAEIAVAASCGCAELPVFSRPKVAVIATGDELTELNQPLEPWQIRNSNTYALAALVAAEGATPQPLPIARDTLADLRDRIATSSNSDLLLLSGGVSMGKFDLVEQALTEAGAEFLFTGALIQPGKPIVFARLPRPDGKWQYLFGLPGNPVSTQVCFHLFVAPLLRALGGATDVAPRFAAATLAEPVTGGASVTRFLPAELTATAHRAEVRLAGWQSSGDVAANARGNCYCVLPPGANDFAAGETVRLLLR